ncbi:MAG: hypothetical protein FJX80_11190, partial [Bacteroidetes bacterium]|nr:hypothetical protein [Bacteroidota bacterium]
MNFEYKDIVNKMTEMMNYISASSYDSQMNLQDKEYLHNLSTVYQKCCETLVVTDDDCRTFYFNLKHLEHVISTDEDVEYTLIYNELVKMFKYVNLKMR